MANPGIRKFYVLLKETNFPERVIALIPERLAVKRQSLFTKLVDLRVLDSPQSAESSIYQPVATGIYIAQENDGRPNNAEDWQIGEWGFGDFLSERSDTEGGSGGTQKYPGNAQQGRRSRFERSQARRSRRSEISGEFLKPAGRRSRIVRAISVNGFAENRSNSKRVVAEIRAASADLLEKNANGKKYKYDRNR